MRSGSRRRAPAVTGWSLRFRAGSGAREDCFRAGASIRWASQRIEWRAGHGDYRWPRRLQIPDHRGLGEASRGLVVQGGGGGRGRRTRQRLRLRARRAPDDDFRPRRQFPALVGRRAVPARPWRPYGAGRFDLPDRRRRPFRAQMRARRQGIARAGRARHARPLSERRAVQPLHPHGPLAKGRNLRLGRLRQRPGPQICAGRQIA